MRPTPTSELATALATALADGDPALHQAAARYRARLEAAWGAPLPEPRTAPPRGAWHGGRLDLVNRLFVAESCALGQVLGALGEEGAGRWVAAEPETLRALMPWATDPAWTATLRQPRATSPRRQAAIASDPAQAALLALLPTGDRRAIGLHPTPPWAAAEVLHVLEPLPPDGTILDPTAGTGVFLCAALRGLWSQAAQPTGDAVWRLADRVRGVETSPLLAATARASLERVARRLSGSDPPPGWRARVIEGDALCDLRVGGAAPVGLARPDGLAPLEAAALVVGNPPWVAWDRLPPGYKAKLAAGPLGALDAFEVTGFEARLGAGNDDVSALFALAGLAHLVRPGGRLAFLLKWNLISNETARVLRRFEVRFAPGPTADRPPVSFALERLADLRAANPFRAQVEPALFVFRRDAVMGARLPAERWIRAGRGRVRREPEVPYGPVRGDDPQGPWAPASEARVATEALAGQFPWPIRHGLKHDCNSVFLVAPLGPTRQGTIPARNLPELSRRIAAPPWSGDLETTFVRPLIQSRHIRAYQIHGWRHVVAPVRQGELLTEAALAEEAPLTLAYLRRHQATLAKRRSRVFARAPFYRLFGYGLYNEAPALVVWSGMGFRPWFAALDTVLDPWLGTVRPLVDSACYLAPCQSPPEAHYLVGLLNSPRVRSFLQSRSSGSKRGLGSATLSRLALPPFDAEDQAHLALAGAAARLSAVHPPDPEHPDRKDRDQGPAPLDPLLGARVDEIASGILSRPSASDPDLDI